MDTGRLWQLTRNEYGRRVYKVLASLGVKVSLMYVYARSLDEVSDCDLLGDDIILETRRGSELDRTDGAFKELDHTDIVVEARLDGTSVGQVFLSISSPVYADPVEMDVGTDTAYIWQLHVDQEYRQRGIGTALVDQACQAGIQEAVSSVTALVAVDNVPSQRLFKTNGFERRSLIIYACLFGVEHRSQRTIADGHRGILGV